MLELAILRYSSLNNGLISHLIIVVIPLISQSKEVLGQFKVENASEVEGYDNDRAHRRGKYERCSTNSLRPKSYFGSIWELYVLELKTKVFCRKGR